MKTLCRRVFGLLVLLSFPIHCALAWMFRDLNMREAGRVSLREWKTTFWYPPPKERP